MSQRDSYEAKVASDFAEAQSQLWALVARAQKAVTVGHAETERLLRAAESRHEEALHLFELLKRAGEDSWAAARTVFETSWTQLRQALAPQRL